ncbi:pyruvate, orthophosphate dikinase [Nonomuraea solani]|uniref:Pyruvate, orthophosphate dikinase n=1 Tax=Nonomuraea solani TaxID=1144553 RepID=A0A1H6EG13_9ACTN|nr:pyruvate, phosphate dikinase [Nonomuraea solani]SEG96750.1 pyruvate, orthophosphate dikinase [Nonomuraea solani]
MTWIHPISAHTRQPVDVLGGKGHGLMVLRRLGLPVPPGFVIGTAACRAFLRDGRFPDGLHAELAAAVTELEAATGRRLGGPERPLTVSVRSGGAVSMPGMMDTILNLGLTPEAAEGLAAESGDPRFALDARQRFLSGFTSVVHGRPPRSGQGAPGNPARLAPNDLTRLPPDDLTRLAPDDLTRLVPEDPMRQLEAAVGAVFASWEAPRARTYRVLNGIPHDHGTAVTVQAMVYGNRDARSGSGVAFSRDPNTGENIPFGDVLFGHQGDDVVSGRATTRPLSDLAGHEPAAWAGLLAALGRIEAHHRAPCYVEFTFEAGELWLLQARPATLTGRAAVRVAVDLVDENVIDRREALRRVDPRRLKPSRTPRIDTTAPIDLLIRGLGACPGVATGRLAVTADAAARMAAGGPVILARPETSPLDLHGLAAAAGVVTARGGPASHAAVVARAMGKPAVVGASGLTVDAVAGHVRAGGRTLPEGAIVTIDGTSGEVVAGDVPTLTDAPDPHLSRLLGWAEDRGLGDR